jgi:hypothetical protein
MTAILERPIATDLSTNLPTGAASTPGTTGIELAAPPITARLLTDPTLSVDEYNAALVRYLRSGRDLMGE